MLEYFLCATSAVVVAIVIVIYLLNGRKKEKKVPGLEPLDSKLGNLADIARAGSLHEFLTELHSSYGPIASFYWGPALAVSIASPELFKEHSKVFDRPVSLFSLFESMITPHSIQYANGSDGRGRRKLYDAAFAHTAMIKYYSLIEEVVNDLVQRLSNMGKDETFPLMDYMMTFAIQSISRVGFGDYFNSERSNELKQAYNSLWAEMELRLSLGAPEPGESRYVTFEKELSKMNKMIREVFEYRKEHPGVAGEPQLIDIFMESGKSDQVQFADTLSYLIGGFHTTGTLLTWFFYYVSKNPDVEAKILQELKDVLKGGTLSPDKRLDLVYTRQVVDETLRCSTLAPWGARFEEEDSVLGGYHIPAKTPVIHALGVMHRNPKYWPNPEKFDPDRFRDKPRNFSFEPFGFAGKRKCPAYQFAYVEIMIAVAALLPKFRFTLKDDQVVTPVFGLVTKPSEEILMTVERRI